MTTTRTLVFARDPEPGRTKTRLIPALGADGACRCYVAMLETMLARLAEHAKGPVVRRRGPRWRAARSATG